MDTPLTAAINFGKWCHQLVQELQSHRRTPIAILYRHKIKRIDITAVYALTCYTVKPVRRFHKILVSLSTQGTWFNSILHLLDNFKRYILI